MQDEIKRLIKAADALAARFDCGCKCDGHEIKDASRSFSGGGFYVEVSFEGSDATYQMCKECQRAETEYNTARAFVKD